MDHENCHLLLNSLSGYVDQDLSPEICTEIERHLAGCEDCRIVIDTLRKTIELYHTTATDTQIPKDVRERLYACLDLNDFLK